MIYASEKKINTIDMIKLRKCVILMIENCDTKIVKFGV